MSEPGDRVTSDRLLGGRLVLRQPARGYRAAIDPVLLAAAAPAGDGHVLDIGCGVGTAMLCLASRAAGCRLTGLEIQPDLAGLAKANVAANGLAERIDVVAGDLLSPPEEIGDAAFDGVLANPPYQAGDQSPPPDGSKAIANQEGAARLEDWVRFAGRVLRPKAWIAMIHRADRIDALSAALHPEFGEIRIVPLWPKPGRPARRVIVLARKGVRSPAALLAGLVLHEEDGDYTAAAEAVLRDGAALPL